MGNPGRAYGSFRVLGTGTAKPIEALRRLQFDRGTNNEAEYWSLLEALRWADDQCRKHKLRPADLELTIQGDSLLVIRQLEGAWKAKDPRMRDLRDQALGLMEPFGRVRLRHQPRRRSVAEFGH